MIKIDGFERARNFKLGLNGRYTGLTEAELADLMNRKLIWYRSKYGYNYWHLTTAGRNLLLGR